jgi:hypothetical protein
MNLYDVIQDENKQMNIDVFCLEIYLKTLIEGNKITNKQRIAFLKSIPVGLPFRYFYNQLNDFSKSIDK